jgi:hypothetical protein
VFRHTELAGVSPGYDRADGRDDGRRRPAAMRSRHSPPDLSQNPIFRGFGNTKFDDGLGWNLDLLLRLWIETLARFPLLLHQLAKAG